MVLTKCFQLFKKLVPVFVQNYAHSQYLLAPKYGQICNAVIPQDILDFAKNFNR